MSQPSGRWNVKDPTEGLARKTASSSAIAIGTEAVEFVIRLGSIAILARLLVPEEFGLIAMVTAVTMIAERFKDMGLSMATVQSNQISDAEASSLFWINLGLGTLIAAVVLALAWPIAAFYNEPRLVPITIWLSSGFVLGALSAQHQALMRRLLMYNTLAKIQLSASVLSVAIAIVLALAGWGYWALVAREIARNLLLAVGNWLGLRWRPSSPFHGADVRRHVRFGANIAAFNLIWFFVQSLDQLVIGRLFGAAQLGLYRQGVALVLGPIYQLNVPVNSVAESVLSRVQNNPVEYARYYVRIVGGFCMAILPMAAFVALFAEELIHFLMGDQWLPASEFVRIFAIVAMVRPASSTVGFVMTTQGRSGRYLAWGLMSAAALSICILLGSHWGARGVAIGHVVAAYAFALPLLVFGFKGSHVGIQHFVAALWRPMIATIIVVSLVGICKVYWLMPLSLALRLLAGGALTFVLYACALLALPGGREQLLAIFKTALALVDRRTAGGKQA